MTKQALNKQDIPAVIERFEGVAAELLEGMISDIEQDDGRIKVKDVEVELVPDPDGETPTVNVTMTVVPPVAPTW
ncbi:MAG: hypothetical protein EOO25_10345 [Comamonadaceae bacterium]|nr:MAG: hypothetical protein EOO25_10345 [Comamonadaceae bacterium]